MSREFGHLSSGFWRHYKIRGLSDAAKLFFLYAVACPHGNSCGSYVLPLAYISADLKWEMKAVAAAIDDCKKAGLIDYDDALDLIRVSGWLNQNPPRNFPMAIGMVRAAIGLPDSEIKTETIAALKEAENQHLTDALGELKGIGTAKPPKPGKAKKPGPSADERRQKKMDADQRAANESMKLAAVLSKNSTDGFSVIFAASSPIPSPERDAAVALCAKAAAAHKIKWKPPHPTS